MAGSYNAGIVTAYGAAVRGGYTGTYEQFCAQQANYAQTAAAVEQAKTDAQAAAQRAQDVADSIPADYSQMSEDVSQLKEELNDNVSDLKSKINYKTHYLTDAEFVESESINQFPPQASLTGGAYLKNGVPIEYEPASYTDYIEIEPDTQYTIGLVPPFGAASLPSYGLPVILELYDWGKAFVQDVSDPTFTTPANARYMRINVATGSGVSIQRLNGMCMMVKGNALPDAYSAWSPTEYKKASDIIDYLSSLEEFVTGYGDDYTALTPISTKANVRVYVLRQNIVNEESDSTQTVYVFPVTAGNKYKLYGFGYDAGDSAFYVACVSKYNIIAEGVASKSDADAVRIPCGRSDYPAGFTYHTLTFIAQYDGFLYVNSKTAQDAPASWIANKVIKTAPDVAEAVNRTYHKHGVYKQGNNYYHFKADGETNIIRKFERRGPNSLFQWSEIAFGSVDGGSVNIESAYGNFGTDIVGPISVWNGTLFPGQYGAWSGGNHGITINGTEYATAEQLEFKCLVNGEEITADGLYYGDVQFVTKNKLYFPQSITGADLSQATPVIIEHRRYYLDEQMHVRVWLEVLNDFRCALYYGMQCVDKDFDTLICPNNDYFIQLSSLVATELHKPERKMLFANDDGLHMDMTLHDVGLGTYSHNSKGNYIYLPSCDNYRKAYFSLIDSTQQDAISAGSNLIWEGTYDLYFG